MSDTKELLERARARFTPPEGVMESLIRRRARKDRNRRISAAALAIIVALVSFAVLIRTFRTVERPAGEPTPRDIFAKVHGWIVYGDYGGIWAVDPTRPSDPEDQVLLSDYPGSPLAWSSDGSKLLIRRGVPDPHRGFDDDLFVLHADGTETLLTNHPGSIDGGSFSPDGSQVVYAATAQDGSTSGIYVVDADGGTPRLLRGPSGEGEVYWPTFSPDGTKIAYFEGGGDHDHNLKVMNADGTHVRVLVGANQPQMKEGWMVGLVWSPDGSQLAFESTFQGEIFVIGADGSGLTRVIPHGSNPSWSPDSSRIAYQPISPETGEIGTLEIADVDGTHVQEFGYGGSGPWNPLPLSASGEEEPAANAGGSAAAPFVLAIAALGLLGVLLLAWRARRRGAATLKRSAVLALALALAACSDGGTRGIAERVTSTPNPPSSQQKSAFVDLQTGEMTPLPQSIAGGYSYRVSPDGTMFAFNDVKEYPPVAVSVANIDGTGVRQISPDGIDAFAASWSPDGSMLVYQGRDAATIEVGNLFVVDVTTGEVRQVTDLKPRYNWWFMWASFAPDGGTILFHLARRHGVGPSGTVWDLWSVSVSGGDPVLVRRNAGFGTYSPDGRTLAFLSPLNPAADATGDALWLVDAGGGDPRALIEGQGIWWPSWSPDGTTIAYAVPKTNDIYIVDVTTGKSTRVARGGVAEWFDDHTLIVGPGIA